jgi:hypothetical protein
MFKKYGHLKTRIDELNLHKNEKIFSRYNFLRVKLASGTCYFDDTPQDSKIAYAHKGTYHLYYNNDINRDYHLGLSDTGFKQKVMQNQLMSLGKAMFYGEIIPSEDFNIGKIKHYKINNKIKILIYHKINKIKNLIYDLFHKNNYDEYDDDDY